MKKTNKKQKADINSLKNKTTKLKDRSTNEATKRNSLKQHGRRQNFEIAGELVTNEKDTNLIVTEITELLNVITTPRDN